MIHSATYQQYKYRKAQRRKIAQILFRAALAIIAGIAIGLLILGVTEPRDAMARAEVVYEPVEAPETEVLTTAEETTEAETETAIEPPTEPTEPELEYLGEFTLTAYCSCRKCCGKWSGGPTASGAMPEAGVTVAVDKSVIALGTEVVIDGYGTFTAQDTGSAVRGRHIDIYFDSHQAALEFGRQTGVKVWAK